MMRRYKRILAGALAAAMLLAPMNTGTAVAKTTAQQQAASYTVSFNACKGKAVKTTLTLSPSDTYGKLPKTSREGYQFKGWYTKKSGGKRVTAKSVFTGSADQVLYARWKKLVQENSTETEASAGDTEGAPTQPEPTGALVAYVPNAATDYNKNDYSDFLVLKNFKAKYLYCQYDYDRFIGSSGKNVGCTATADAMLASIYMDKAFSPNDEGWISGVGATWTNSVIADGSKTYSVKEQCAATYSYLQEGIPVLIRVIGHSVTAIGVRKNVGREEVTPADILIADPADGKVKCADEMGYRVMTDANGWGLRIPKGVVLSKQL